MFSFKLKMHQNLPKLTALPRTPCWMKGMGPEEGKSEWEERERERDRDREERERKETFASCPVVYTLERVAYTWRQANDWTQDDCLGD